MPAIQWRMKSLPGTKAATVRLDWASIFSWISGVILLEIMEPEWSRGPALAGAPPKRKEDAKKEEPDEEVGDDDAPKSLLDVTDEAKLRRSI